MMQFMLRKRVCTAWKLLAEVENTGEHWQCSLWGRMRLKKDLSVVSAI